MKVNELINIIIKGLFILGIFMILSFYTYEIMGVIGIIIIVIVFGYTIILFDLLEKYGDREIRFRKKEKSK